jgi:hypothetical protein
MHVRRMPQAFEVKQARMMSNCLHSAYAFTFRFPYGGGGAGVARARETYARG